MPPTSPEKEMHNVVVAIKKRLPCDVIDAISPPTASGGRRPGVSRALTLSLQTQIVDAARNYLQNPLIAISQKDLDKLDELVAKYDEAKEGSEIVGHTTAISSKKARLKQLV